MIADLRGSVLFRRVVGALSAACAGLSLAACEAFDEVNLFAGDSKMSFAQTSSGAFVRTDAGALGDLSETLPEGVVPVGNVMSPQGEVPQQVASSTGEEGGGGFNFGNITFRTARSAEREAAREASGPTGDTLPGDDDGNEPGLLMRLLGWGNDPASSASTGGGTQLGEDGLPVVTFDTAQQGRAKVNKYLWNATAQILAFMPVSVADQQRGLYVTDWHMDSQQSRPERVRVDVQHLSDVIGPGSFHVTVYRQILDGTVWRGAPSSLPAARELESRILAAAQDLKIADG